MHPSDIGRTVHRLDIHIRRYVDTCLNRREIESVTGNNSRVIGYLAEHAGREVCQRDLETAFGITPSTASKMVSLMERKGLLARSPVERDARLKRLELTDKSRALAETMGADHAAVEALLLRGFSAADTARLRRYLARMLKNLSEGETK